MTWWQALILGIVEGVTEYLPVSSTGHLILASWLMGLDRTDELKQAVDTFSIVVQAGAIAAVLGLYRSRVVQMLRGLMGRDDEGRRLAINLAVAFLPAALLGPLLADAIESHLFHPWPVVGALFLGAWLMIAVGWQRKDDADAGLELEGLTLKIALMIGIGQCLAMWPGTSRSMMTIVTALALGLRPRAAAEFSFLLGLITLTAATGYKAVFGASQMLEQMALSSVIIGLVAATLSAAIAVHWFVAMLVRHGLAPFGWYRLALAAVLGLCLWFGLM
ncbi:MAG: UDP-diphosphatase [Phycisphaeraceae bacterium]|nr:UDP-diphosphatase [Phycisphaeraceae bacterium]